MFIVKQQDNGKYIIVEGPPSHDNEVVFHLCSSMVSDLVDGRFDPRNWPKQYVNSILSLSSSCCSSENLSVACWEYSTLRIRRRYGDLVSPLQRMHYCVTGSDRLKVPAVLTERRVILNTKLWLCPPHLIDFLVCTFSISILIMGSNNSLYKLIRDNSRMGIFAGRVLRRPVVTTAVYTLAAKIASGLMPGLTLPRAWAVDVDGETVLTVSGLETPADPAPPWDSPYESIYAWVDDRFGDLERQRNITSIFAVCPDDVALERLGNLQPIDNIPGGDSLPDGLFERAESLSAAAEAVIKAVGDKVGGQLRKLLRLKKKEVKTLRDILSQFAKNRFSTGEGNVYSGMNELIYRKSRIFWCKFTERSVGDLLVIIDTSGSMSDREITEAWSAIVQLCDEIAVDKITIVAGDVDYSEVAKFDRHNIHEIFSFKPRFVGGGGTDMGKILRECVEKYGKDNIAVSIVLTDGYTPWCDDLGVPTIVALVGSRSADQSSVPSWAISCRVQPESS